jgi:hypothetical protein
VNQFENIINDHLEAVLKDRPYAEVADIIDTEFAKDLAAELYELVDLL